MKTIVCFLSILILTTLQLGSQEIPEISITKDTIVVGYTHSAPFVFQENDELNGVSVRLWNDITSDDDSHYILKYYPFEELINGLEQNTIQIALSPISLTHARSKSIDFSAPYFVSNSNVVTRELTFKQKVLAFFESISIISLLEVLGFLLILLSVFGFLVWRFEKKNNEEFHEGIRGFWDGLWWSAVTMTTVGYGDKSPKTTGGRIIGLVWMFSAIILISSITAGITSSLTVKKLGYVSGDYSYFDEINIGVVKNMTTETKLKRRYTKNLMSYETLDELMVALKNDDVQVVSHDEPALLYALHNNPDYKDFLFLKIKFNQALYAFGFSKKLNQSKKDELSRKILKFTEGNDWKMILAQYDLLKSQNLLLTAK